MRIGVSSEENNDFLWPWRKAKANEKKKLAAYWRNAAKWRNVAYQRNDAWRRHASNNESGSMATVMS